MMQWREEKGFSLVELMIVVAIMAILAAIAIPSFLRFSMRSKTAEATSNLSAIRTGEESYRSENDVYFACAQYPAAVPSSSGTLWVTDASGNFRDIGFAADGIVRFAYTVTAIAPVAGVSPPYFTATAQSDIDDDGVASLYMVSNDPAEGTADSSGDTAPAVYPKAIHDATSDDF